MPVDKNVLAIIVNWNGAEVLPGLLDSLLHASHRALQVLVVDNASSDESCSNLPHGIRLLRLDKNLGYGGAVNAGVRFCLAESDFQAPVDYFLVLNNDLVVPPQTIEELVLIAERRGPGVFGPCILKWANPTILEAAWGKVSWSHVLAHFYGKEGPFDDRWKRDLPVQLLLGSALLIHRDVFEKVGLFDERFFMYHEEVDFLYRVNRAGMPTYFCYPSAVLHRGMHSTKGAPERKAFWVRQNAVKFLRKHDPGLTGWAYFCLTLAGSLIWNILRLRWSRCRTIITAVITGFREEESLELDSQSLGDSDARPMPDRGAL